MHQGLLFHIASVQDGWIHEDILRVEPVLASDGALKDTEGGPAYAGFAIKTLVDYWKAVEQSTLAYLSRLTEEELHRIVAAQIAMLLRMQGIKPPSLDLLFYLPPAA